MNLHFYKYHGTGNDFILVDDREKSLNLNQEQISFLCHRHFGIGADGLMLLHRSDSCDFNMVYFNSDGNESSMCGNGGRCITAFAKRLGLINQKATFQAIDGIHHAYINEHDSVSLQMQDVTRLENFETYTELNTGSPHYVHFTQEIEHLDVNKEGALIRNSPKFKNEGINVNFVEILDENVLFVRTYERGVEAETYSCGTGVTAAAIAYAQNKSGQQKIHVKTLGGELQISFDVVHEQLFENIYLEGPAKFVFSGHIDI